MSEIQSLNHELERCIGCNHKPCKAKCPLENDITEMIRLSKNKEYRKAYELSCETSVLQSVCGRICPHEEQCQSNCTRRYQGEPISIGKIEAFLGDIAIQEGWNIPSISEELAGKNIAIIGSGPSGLTCAAFLARRGANVTIYEKHDQLGGLLRYGIPTFRLERKVLDNVIKKILELGISSVTNIELGKDISLEELNAQYDAVYLAFGANISKKMNIPGENVEGVWGANELLEYERHPDYKNKTVFISGGGNVAIDSARTVKRLGAERVIVVYRRCEEDMPAEIKEIQDAKKDGVEFLFHTNIVKVLADTDEKVCGIECIKTKYETSSVEEAGRNRKLVNIPDTNFKLEGNYLLMAVGSKPEEGILSNLGLELNEWGSIKVDEKHQTSSKKVFAGGDLVGEKATVAWAARSGRDAAESITAFLEEK